MLKAGVLCSLLALISALTCPDSSVCKDDSTCCLAPSNKYGCCSLPNAVCCAEHLHCCYEGTICDAENGKCLNRTHSLPWLERVPAELPKLPQTVRSFSMIHAVPVNLDFGSVCPDETLCPGGFSCLKTLSGKYSCCPLPQGVSCFDGSHCCPDEYQCSKDGASCSRNAERVEAVICPDGESECPDETTCCLLPDGSWGCCPMAKAVCCADKKHCCPEGTTCDLEHSMCVTASRKRVPMWEKLPARRRAAWEDQEDAVNVTSVTCPDGRSRCQDGSTCCQMISGLYGCCPYPDALCCSDHLHCCPGGTTCDLEHMTCSPGERPPVEERLLAPPRDVECPDMQTMCPDETTCCQLTDGSYGCCPMPRAVCCEDHIHCCPEATTCDLVHSKCLRAGGNTTWATKMPAVRVPAVESTGNDVPCNDSVACADGSTCCKTAGGQWACCPLPQAVCCEDHLHCCPEGTVCNLAASTCDDPWGSTSWLEKVPAVSKAPERETPDGGADARLTAEAENVPCDPTHACPTGSTCCKTEEGEWACCPLPQAVCCEDHLHCCPKGTVCNLAASTCDDPWGSAPWLEKVPALPWSPANEKCDDEMVCPSGTTCCRQNTGDWACCPLPHAVCCEDHEHCCPKGYKCDVSQQTCVRPGELSLPWARKRPALPAGSSPPDTRQCDPKTACPRDTTCCYMDKLGKWGCCPLPNAVCCDDGDHCCPEGYKCDVARATCKRGGLAIPWYRKEGAFRVLASLADVGRDARKSCAAGTARCRLPTGQRGCCPLVETTPETIPETTPEPTLETTPEPNPEPTPGATPETTPEPTPETIPETTPEPTLRPPQSLPQRPSQKPTRSLPRREMNSIVMNSTAVQKLRLAVGLLPPPGPAAPHPRPYAVVI
ncbi:hypothetical protein ANANG_G00043520 [Anguilla anguilla]|uniref:Granulins domain-containing protein n=1 Tax=Anguilla anguilla TaxID=7936 RepID=A0A9D3S7V7_ANGAN|nr:hypothetical protein ANANG_G00043520 [Anguilla anguilla]